MLHQMYLNSNGDSIFLVINRPKKDEIKNVLIMLPGFSEPGNDQDYFLSRLSQKLVQLGFLVVQVEPHGHGNSYGDLSTFNWDRLKSNLMDTIDYFSKSYNKTLFFLTRGLFCSLCLDTEIIQKVAHSIAINPVIITSEELSYLTNEIHEGVFELSDGVLNNDDLWYLFQTMGASKYNICAQKIQKKNLIELLERCINKSENSRKVSYIISDNNSLTLNKYDRFGSIPYIPLQKQAEKAMISHPDWIEMLINYLCKEIQEIV